MDNSAEDSNKELLNRFRDDLSRPSSERYYSEDELVCIFDNAGDTGNDYLRMEALILGARLYPDSRELLERRAIFYQSFPDSAFDDFLSDNPSVTAPLWEILKLSRFEGSHEQAREALDSFIRDHSLTSDEEVIQFIELAHRLNHAEWVFENIELLKSKVDYLATLLYEIAVIAQISNRQSIEIDMLEQLTEFEPYNAEYWEMLARAYAAAGRTDDTASAIDLSLAIDPRNPRAIVTKIECLGIKPASMVHEILEAFRNDSTDPALALKAIEATAGDPDLCHRIITHASESIPDNPTIVMAAINSGFEDIDEMLTRLFNSGYTSYEAWEELTNDAYTAGAYNAVSVIMQVYKRLTGRALNNDFVLLKILFRLKQYLMVVNVFQSTEEGSIMRSENLFEAYILVVISMLRMGRIEEASNCAEEAVKNLEPPATDINLRSIGMRTIMKDILKRIRSVRRTNWESYDPLGIETE